MNFERRLVQTGTRVTLAPSAQEREQWQQTLTALDQVMRPLAGSEPSAVRASMQQRLDALPPLDLGEIAVTDISLSGRALSIREYQPPAPAGEAVIIYLHGGGWVLGTVTAFDRQCVELAQATRHRVLSVDYRLAPEHPYPAALEDTLVVIAEFAAAAGLSYVIAGESAGGGLAFSAALALRDAGARMPAALIAWYPVVAPAQGPPQERSESALLRAADLTWFWDNYLSGKPVGSGYAAPLLHSPLTGLPPAMVILAERDPSRAHAIEFIARLRRAAIHVSVVDCLELPHAFRALRTATGDQTVRLAARWVDQWVGR